MPGGLGTESESYRPISLLSPETKTIKDLIFFVKRRWLNQNKPPHRTGLIILDLSRAFHTVNQATMFEDFERTTFRPSLTRWIINYMCGIPEQEVQNSQNEIGSFPRWDDNSGTVSGFYVVDDISLIHSMNVITAHSHSQVEKHITPATKCRTNLGLTFDNMLKSSAQTIAIYEKL